MADITMCTGRGCPRKNDCYRHTAQVNHLWQSYMLPPAYEEVWKCTLFIQNSGKSHDNGDTEGFGL